MISVVTIEVGTDYSTVPTNYISNTRFFNLVITIIIVLVESVI